MNNYILLILLISENKASFFFFCLFTDILERELIGKTWLTYLTGKGNHLVPILFPEDTHKALKFLSDEDVRRKAGVLAANRYIFPSTMSSERYCSGWHAVDNVCKKLNLANRSKINATKNRHRVSTLYSIMDLPPETRSSFCEHMGHTESMSKERLVHTQYL